MDFNSPPEDDLTFEDDPGNVVDEADVQRQVATSAVELEELLKKKNYTQFRAKLNLPTYLADTDPIEQMIELASRSSGMTNPKKVLCKNLFNVLCCLAGESVDNAGMSLANQFMNFNLKFIFWEKSFHEKAEFYESVVQLFPGKVLPEYFGQYIETQKSSPTTRWVKDNGISQMSLTEQQGMKFGSIVKMHISSSCVCSSGRLVLLIWRKALQGRISTAIMQGRSG